MIIIRLIEFLKQRIKTVVRLALIALVLLIVIDSIPLIVDKEHAHTWLEKVPGFWSIFGFVGCVGIIVISKWFGHLGIMTREDYYDE